MNDFERHLRSCVPAEPSISLKNRLRARLQPHTPPWAALLLRLALPAACLLVIGGLTAGRFMDAPEPTAFRYGQISALASTSLYFPDGETPVQVTRTASQTYVAWHDGKAGQEIVRTFPSEQIVITPLSIQ